jgi:predicted O-methyltransferase YrrM
VSAVRLRAYLMSCEEREQTRAVTIQRLLASGWGETPTVVLDEGDVERKQEREERTTRRLLRAAISDPSVDVALLLQDDLDFNRHLRHNLLHWPPLRAVQRGDHFFGSLYNPGISGGWRDPERSCFHADPDAVYGSQAVLVSISTGSYIDAHWDEVVGMSDIKMSRLAARLGPLHYHVPSLVQHVGEQSTWGGHFHWAADFDADWRAAGEPAPPGKKALVTAGSGPYAELLALTRSSFEAFAERHGYELVVGTGEEAPGRPPAWAKVALLREALRGYALALWIDADAMIVDPSGDPAERLAPWAFQALTEHRTGQGQCPNTGVWLLRTGARSAVFLDAVWAAADYLMHPWWENAAVCALLGYDPALPCRRVRDTPHLEGTQWLGNEWNSIPHDPAEHPRIVHLAGEPLPVRSERLRELVRPRPPARVEPDRLDVEALVATAVERMRPVDGWFSEAEARALGAAVARVLAGGVPPGAVVEVGSMWGRSTVALATIVAAITPAKRLVAVDPHEGEASALQGGLMRVGSTYARYLANLRRAGVADAVQTIRARSYETPWSAPIAVLFIDGLHDYENVARDTRHFLSWLGDGGLLAFHDYGTYFPGVKRFVDELLDRPDFELCETAENLALLRHAPQRA